MDFMGILSPYKNVLVCTRLMPARIDSNKRSAKCFRVSLFVVRETDSKSCCPVTDVVVAFCDRTKVHRVVDFTHIDYEWKRAPVQV
jgi:hypothetical protein